MRTEHGELLLEPVQKLTPNSDQADAQDRLRVLSRMTQGQTNRYYPALIIITWSDESLDELEARVSLPPRRDL